MSFEFDSKILYKVCLETPKTFAISFIVFGFISNISCLVGNSFLHGLFLFLLGVNLLSFKQLNTVLLLQFNTLEISIADRPLQCKLIIAE